MKAIHQILHLNSSRTYVFVNEAWYDTRADFVPEVGQNFLDGRIEKVLSYQEYIEQFPNIKTKDEIYPFISDKTVQRGYIRRVINGVVTYAVNPATPRVSNISDKTFLSEEE